MKSETAPAFDELPVLKQAEWVTTYVRLVEREKPLAAFEQAQRDFELELNNERNGTNETVSRTDANTSGQGQDTGCAGSVQSERASGENDSGVGRDERAGEATDAGQIPGEGADDSEAGGEEGGDTEADKLAEVIVRVEKGPVTAADAPYLLNNISS